MPFTPNDLIIFLALGLLGDACLQLLIIAQYAKAFDLFTYIYIFACVCVCV